MSKSVKGAALLEKELVARGWEKDRYGHYRKDAMVQGRPVRYRVKMQAKSCRLERQVQVNRYSGASLGMKKVNEWMRVGGCYYSEVRVDEEGLHIGTLLSKNPK